VQVKKAGEFMIFKNKEQKNRDPSQKILDRIGLLTVIIIPAIWALLTYDKLAVTSEGWFIVYSRMILDGQIPYRDFEMVFPPLYTYISSSVVLVFGETLLPFRIIGVLLFISITVVSYHIFKMIFPSWIAAVAAITTIFVLNSEIHVIAYDYSRFFDLFNYLSFYLVSQKVPYAPALFYSK